MWLGPTPEVVLHRAARASAARSTQRSARRQSRPGWLRNEAYCLGMITGLGRASLRHGALGHGHGAHRPVQASKGSGEFPTNKIWNVHGAYNIELTYPGNIKHDACRTSCRTASSSSATKAGSSCRATRSSDGERSDGGADALKPLDASDPRLLDPNGLTVRAPAQHVAPQELARVRAVAQAAARARADRASQQHRVHRQLDRDEARPSAHLGCEGRAFRERRRGERDALAPRTRAVRRDRTRPSQDRHADRCPRSIRLRRRLGTALSALSSWPLRIRLRPQVALQGGPATGALPAHHARPRALPRRAGAEVHVRGRRPRRARLCAGGRRPREHLERIEGFNTRARSADALASCKPYTGPDFLERMLADSRQRRRHLRQQRAQDRVHRAVDRSRAERARRQADGASRRAIYVRLRAGVRDRGEQEACCSTTS